MAQIRATLTGTSGVSVEQVHHELSKLLEIRLVKNLLAQRGIEITSIVVVDGDGIAPPAAAPRPAPPFPPKR